MNFIIFFTEIDRLFFRQTYCGGINLAKFAYKVLTYDNLSSFNDDSTLENDLVALGEQGWELVSALPMVKGDGTFGNIGVGVEEIKFIFKRPIE